MPAGEIDRDRLIHDLEVHQAELESQNRELREMQQLLEESRSRYADLYDFAPVGYCTIDKQGRIVELNLAAAALLGRERGFILQRPLVTFLASGDRPRFQQHVADCMLAREPRTIEVILATRPSPPSASQRATVVQISSSPIVGKHDECTGCRSALFDVSQRRQGEDSLRLAIHMRESFLAVVSHDLRNPLNSILLATQVLLRTAPVQERRSTGRRQLESIQHAAERMTRLVSDLLDLSSMDAGHLSMQRETHDVAELIATAVDGIRATAVEKSLSVICFRFSIGT